MEDIRGASSVRWHGCMIDLERRKKKKVCLFKNTQVFKSKNELFLTDEKSWLSGPSVPHAWSCRISKFANYLAN